MAYQPRTSHEILRSLGARVVARGGAEHYKTPTLNFQGLVSDYARTFHENDAKRWAHYQKTHPAEERDPSYRSLATSARRANVVEIAAAEKYHAALKRHEDLKAQPVPAESTPPPAQGGDWWDAFERGEDISPETLPPAVEHRNNIESARIDVERASAALETARGVAQQADRDATEHYNRYHYKGGSEHRRQFVEGEAARALGPADRDAVIRSKSSGIRASGNTFAAKDDLKAAGFKWDGASKTWKHDGKLTMKEKANMDQLMYRLKKQGVRFD